MHMHEETKKRGWSIVTTIVNTFWGPMWSRYVKGNVQENVHRKSHPSGSSITNVHASTFVSMTKTTQKNPIGLEAAFGLFHTGLFLSFVHRWLSWLLS